MADNEIKILLQQILAKSDALELKLDKKLTKTENARTETNGINKNFETYKEQNYEEIKMIN